jgi:hypothetical protein
LIVFRAAPYFFHILFPIYFYRLYISLDNPVGLRSLSADDHLGSPANPAIHANPNLEALQVQSSAGSDVIDFFSEEIDTADSGTRKKTASKKSALGKLSPKNQRARNFLPRKIPISRHCSSLSPSHHAYTHYD